MSVALVRKDYQRKIKTKEELRAILGAHPRKKTAIMCHGTFDIVHPGHVRHLMYCKDKADFLIASLTSDVHISKGEFRPFVPQDLRAMNLAALEVVDFVTIDPNATPLENLKYIQPDYFAKGYEYFQDGEIHPKTKEELAIIESYGGEIIFSPGDVVYSSSALIETEPPQIAADKLFMLMNAENITFADLRNALVKCQGVRVHVVGDTIVDSHTHTTMIGGGTKTPTLSVKLEQIKNYAGGAAVVAKHLRKAGAEVEFSTVLGQDDLKDFVLKEMREAGVNCDAIIDRTRPTTQKNVIICAHHRLLKVDKLDNRAVSGKVLERLQQNIAKTPTDAVVFSDFRHGIFSQPTIPGLIQAIPKGVFKVADSQVASRWGNILDFKGFDLITPNEREARFSMGDQDSVIRPLALKLFEQAQCSVLILKLGQLGSITYRKASHQDPRAFFTVDSFADRVVDPVGAGDALLAYATLALVATKSEVIASILGSMAAAVLCSLEGNNPVTPKQVLEVINLAEKRATYT